MKEPVNKKLDREKVKEIKILLRSGKKYREIAEQYGIGMKTIANIASKEVHADVTFELNGRTWN